MAGLEGVKGLCGYIGSTTSDFGGEIEGEGEKKGDDVVLYGGSQRSIQSPKNEE